MDRRGLGIVTPKRIGRNNAHSRTLLGIPHFWQRASLKQEVKVSTRINIATLFALSLATPALADCNNELKTLEQNVVSAATGASTNESGMPATKHQEETLAGKQKGRESEATGSTAGAVPPASPHQEQVTGKGSTQNAEASRLMAEARKMSAAGDEKGCLKKVAELKGVLGVK
jgi:hypothetical protein